MYNSGILLSAGSAEDMLLFMAVIVGALLLILAFITGFTFLKRNWRKLPDMLSVMMDKMAKKNAADGSIRDEEENRHDFSPI